MIQERVSFVKAKLFKQKIIMSFVFIFHFLYFSCQFWYDSRLRCDIVDLYFKLYGRKRPHAVPIPELAMLKSSFQSKGDKSKAEVS